MYGPLVAPMAETLVVGSSFELTRSPRSVQILQFAGFGFCLARVYGTARSPLGVVQRCGSNGCTNKGVRNEKARYITQSYGLHNHSYEIPPPRRQPPETIHDSAVHSYSTARPERCRGSATVRLSHPYRRICPSLSGIIVLAEIDVGLGPTGMRPSAARYAPGDVC